LRGLKPYDRYIGGREKRHIRGIFATVQPIVVLEEGSSPDLKHKIFINIKIHPDVFVGEKLIGKGHFLINNCSNVILHFHKSFYSGLGDQTI